jgi:hypothetical protein
MPWLPLLRGRRPARLRARARRLRARRLRLPGRRGPALGLFGRPVPGVSGNVRFPSYAIRAFSSWIAAIGVGSMPIAIAR